MNADTKTAWQDALNDLARKHSVTWFVDLPDAGHRVLIDPPAFKRNLDPSVCRIRSRIALAPATR